MVENIATAFKEMLSKVKWMDSRARRNAIEKVYYVFNISSFQDLIIISLCIKQLVSYLNTLSRSWKRHESKLLTKTSFTMMRR